MPRQVSFFTPDAVTPSTPAAAALSLYGARRANPIALNALQEGTSTAPLQGGIGEGFTRLGNALLGGFMLGDDKRRGSEAGRRMADAILAAMPEDQRAGPAGQALRAGLQDEDTRAALMPGLMQNLTRPQAEPPAGFMRDPSNPNAWIPRQGGPEDPAYLARRRIATDPNAGLQVIPNEGNPLVFDAQAWRAGQGQPGAAPAPGGVPPTGTTAVGQQLAQGESGGNPNAIGPPVAGPGSEQAQGVYQFLPSTWATVSQQHPELGLTPAGIRDPQQQQRAFLVRAQDIVRSGQDLIGRQIGNATVTPEALIRGAWMGGDAGVRRFIESNGQVNPRDANGVSIGDYFFGTARNLPQMMSGNPQSVSRMPAGPMGQQQPPGGATPPVQVAQAGGALPMGADAPPGSTAPQAVAGPPSRIPVPGQLQGQPPPQYPRGLTPMGAQQPNSQRVFGMERELANDLRSNPISRQAREIIPSMQSMYESAQRDNITGDIDLIFGVAKLIDPGSVVRESDQRIVVGNSQSLPSTIVGYINGLNGGTRLSADARESLLQLARQRAQGFVDQHNMLRDDIADQARAYGLNPERVVGRAITLPEHRHPVGYTPPAATPGTAAPGSQSVIRWERNPQTGALEPVRQ